VGLTYELENAITLDRRHEIVSTMRGCANYLAAVVDEVLDISKIEAGAIDLKLSTFSPACLLKEVASIMAADALAVGACIIIEVGKGVPAMLTADEGRIREILINFTSNAIKHAGGEIFFNRARYPRCSKIIEFSVRDRGPGLGPRKGLLFSVDSFVGKVLVNGRFQVVGWVYRSVRSSPLLWVVKLGWQMVLRLAPASI